MDTDTLGFALVGCGFISSQHARGIREAGGDGPQPACELRVACDVDVRRAQTLAAEADPKRHPAGVAWTADFEEVLRREDVAVVDICTLPTLHAEMAVRAAQAGKHILVEKPIATSTAEADRMIAAAREAGVRLAVIHQLRFAAINRRAAELLKAGAIGSPYFVDIAYRTFRPQSYFDQNERGTGRLDGGGAFITHAIHDLDLMLMFMGPVRSVLARTAVLGHRMAVEDAGIALFEFKSGALGVLSTGTCIKRRHDRTVEIHGSEGTLAHNEKVLEHYVGRGRPIMSEEFGAEPPGALHKIQIQDLVQAIREGREPVVNGEAARRPLALVEAIYASSRELRPVFLSEG